MPKTPWSIVRSNGGCHKNMMAHTGGSHFFPRATAAAFQLAMVFKKKIIKPTTVTALQVDIPVAKMYGNSDYTTWHWGVQFIQSCRSFQSKWQRGSSICSEMNAHPYSFLAVAPCEGNDTFLMECVKKLSFLNCTTAILHGQPIGGTTASIWQWCHPQSLPDWEAKHNVTNIQGRQGGFLECAKHTSWSSALWAKFPTAACIASLAARQGGTGSLAGTTRYLFKYHWLRNMIEKSLEWVATQICKHQPFVSKWFPAHMKHDPSHNN